MVLLNETISDSTAFGGAPVTVFVVLLGLVFGWYELVYMVLLGMALSYMVTVTIKMIYFRDRPIRRKKGTFIQKMEAGSFPSLHSMRATVIYGLLAFYFQDLWFGVLCLFLILIVSLTRVYLKKHWLSDVIGGVILGWLIVMVLQYLFI